MTDGLALWLVITGSALGTGVVLWLLKLLIDATSDTAPTTKRPPKPAAPVPAEPLWPATPAPHAHTHTCTGETLHLTTVQAHRARHAKPRTAA
ncbi:hypothetical protein [Streptomyces stelliscabiei]|uniref:Uncharacterized protein n=1 Tax=Streptomyces stelliscabiei TaxID=146820 RepID=A0A8I0P7L6_9ACTN|nr:hypothetical protein [Streptomyces stelliscabiei]MBE1599007.1 hypothetical protein [Streptomyces stelliscabiei]